ncbi:invasion associated locus B family protein [Roseibium sp. SCP14]|uniref:invasion associated locus B family protein n=1 Tax=Roseibium sp. SCP14 TaxID=3141375 RepID=UPI003334D4ED
MKSLSLLAIVGICCLSLVNAEPTGAQVTASEPVSSSTANGDASVPRESGGTSAAISETDFDAWKKVCVLSAAQQREVCGLAYAGLSERSGSLINERSPLIAVTVQSVNSQGKPQPILLIRTRLGLLLPGGLELRIDGRKPVKAAFRSCHANRQETGCLVPIRLSGSFARNLKRGINLTVTAKTLQGDTLSQQVSLLGITQALKALTDN